MSALDGVGRRAKSRMIDRSFSSKLEREGERSREKLWSLLLGDDGSFILMLLTS
jgi:hypothetical protein